MTSKGNFVVEIEQTTCHYFHTIQEAEKFFDENYTTCENIRMYVEGELKIRHGIVIFRANEKVWDWAVSGSQIINKLT